MGVGFNPFPIYKMEQHRSKLKKFVERIKKEAFLEGYEEGYKEGLIQGVTDEMNTKQWDKDIEKTIPYGTEDIAEFIRHRTVSEFLKEKEK